MKKAILILKEKTIKLKVNNEFFELFLENSSYVLAYRYLKAIYIFQSLAIEIAIFYELSKKVPTFLINPKGDILAKLEILK